MPTTAPEFVEQDFEFTPFAESHLDVGEEVDYEDAQLEKEQEEEKTRLLYQQELFQAVPDESSPVPPAMQAMQFKKDKAAKMKVGERWGKTCTR